MNSLKALILQMHSFHFIRPYGLWMIVPALLMIFLLLRREKMSNAWQRYIDPVLLMPLLQGKINRTRKTLPTLALLFWILCALALAGPTWEKLPTPIEKRDTALVILMDLSPSMLAGDVKPSRLIAARHKIMDLLQLRKEGYSALIGYSGDAHVVSPLTDDTQTIANLLNVLEPGIMPVLGSNVEDALTLSLQLFQNGGYTQGDILLVTDGITEEALENSARLLKGKSFTLSIIGVGTETGGPIPTNNGDFLKSQQGKIILPQLHAEQLMALAKKVNGYYSPLQLDDRDIQPLVNGTALFNRDLMDKSHTKKTDREFDQWRDVGGALCLSLLPLLLIGFRRGVLVSLVLVIPLMHVAQTQAADTSTEVANKSSFHIPAWSDLWLNDNQRAMKAIKNKDYETAAKKFNDPDWKAAAQYESGDYENAIKHYEKGKNTANYYNLGNSLTKYGDFENAIKAYDEALKLNPKDKDAAHNREIAKNLLEQQKKQPKQNQGDNKNPNNGTKPCKDGDTNCHQQENKPGNQEQNKNSGQQDDQKHDSGNQNNQTDQNPNGEQKAHQDDNNKSNQDAQKKSSENGKDQSDQNATNKSEKDESGEKQDPSNEKENPASAESKLTPEQKQALEQWLRQVPDDPSGLLRNKFEYYYQQHLQEQQSGKAPKHSNDEERW